MKLIAEAEKLSARASQILLSELKPAQSGPSTRSRPSQEGRRQDSAHRPRDAAFLALAYSCGLRRSEAVAIDVTDSN